MKKMIQMLILIFFTFSALAATCSSAAPDTNSNVTADFSATPASGAAPLSVQFTDKSAGSPTSWIWNFGDGANSLTKNPTHIYSSAGVYAVILTVRNQAGSSQKTGTITVTARKPVAAFSASPTSGNSPLTVNFADKSTGSPTSWLWNFGDGSTSNLQNPSHIYYGVGTYSVSLTVTNTAGSSLRSSLINVSSTPAIIADFNSNVTAGTPPLTVRFNDLTTGSPTTWEWDFNSDGLTDSVEKNPVYQFNNPGTYTVTLRAGSGTARGIVTKTNYITVGNGLQAVFTANTNQGVAPLNVQFTDNSIGAPTAWLWDLGDGNNSTLQNPVHLYTQAGSYAVKLTASNNFDRNTSQIPFFVNVSSFNTPATDFNSNLTSGNTPLTVQFNDLSTGTPTVWEWDFNSDGQVDSNEQNPVYEFLYPGNYNVTLRAGNGAGWGSITKINYITIGAGFQAGFTASPIQGDAPLPVQFTDTSTGNVTSWLWDFGDGSNSTSQNPTHTYSGPGSYNVTLNVSNMNESRVLTLPGYITVTQGSGSSSSGGGGSSSTGTGSTGTGGSPEPASNIAVKLQTQRYIAAGNHIKFEFTKNATTIDFVEFDAKKTLGKITTTIEQLKGRSVLTPTDPKGKVYKYLNIWVGNNGIAIPGNIENATVEFILNKAEIKIDATEKSTVILQRYAQGKWDPLNTIKTGEDDQYIYYLANTPGFSSFAITSSAKPNKEDVSQPNEENISRPVEANISQPKNLYNDQLSIQNKQPRKSEAINNINWSKYSGVIRFFVLFIVVLFIGLVIREKRK